MCPAKNSFSPLRRGGRREEFLGAPTSRASAGSANKSVAILKKTLDSLSKICYKPYWNLEEVVLKAGENWGVWHKHPGSGISVSGKT